MNNKPVDHLPPMTTMRGDDSSDSLNTEMSEGVRVTVLVLGWLACVNGVFGNVLIIVTLLSQQALRSVHNIYIANLALADFLATGYSLLFWLLDLNDLDHSLVRSTYHCNFNAFLHQLCTVASIYTLLCVAFDR